MPSATLLIVIVPTFGLLVVVVLAVVLFLVRGMSQEYLTFDQIVQSVEGDRRVPQTITITPGKGPVRTEWAGAFLGETGSYRFGLSYEVSYVHWSEEEPREYREVIMRGESSEHTLLDNEEDYKRKVKCMLVAEERAEQLRKQFPDTRIIVKADPVTSMNDELRATLNQEALRLGLTA